MKMMANANVQYVKGIKEKHYRKEEWLADDGHRQCKNCDKKNKNNLWNCIDCRKTLKKVSLHCL